MVKYLFKIPYVESKLFVLTNSIFYFSFVVFWVTRKKILNEMYTYFFLEIYLYLIKTGIYFWFIKSRIFINLYFNAILLIIILLSHSFNCDCKHCRSTKRRSTAGFLSVQGNSRGRSYLRERYLSRGEGGTR